jgi:hypothetical protein
LAQPVPLVLDPLKLALQSLDLATRLLELRDRLVLRPRGWRVVAHTPVMPEQRDLYKSEPFEDCDQEWLCEGSDPLIKYHVS